MHTPNPPQDEPDYSPSDENEIQPIYNEATMNRPQFADEDEWLASFDGILSLPTLFNPVTASFVEPDEE